MRFWYWLLKIFRRRAVEAEVYDREALRKANLDESARQAQRWTSSGSRR